MLRHPTSIKAEPKAAMLARARSAVPLLSRFLSSPFRLQGLALAALQEAGPSADKLISSDPEKPIAQPKLSSTYGEPVLLRASATRVTKHPPALLLCPAVHLTPRPIVPDYEVPEVGKQHLVFLACVHAAQLPGLQVFGNVHSTESFSAGVSVCWPFPPV
jgi:hypothetical protein